MRGEKASINELPIATHTLTLHSRISKGMRLLLVAALVAAPAPATDCHRLGRSQDMQARGICQDMRPARYAGGRERASEREREIETVTTAERERERV